MTSSGEAVKLKGIRVAVLSLLALGGCASPRRVIAFDNQSDQPVEVVLEERNAAYPTLTSLPTPVAVGAKAELWWDRDFKTELVVRAGGREVGRAALTGKSEVVLHR